jgi:hypothetical protein
MVMMAENKHGGCKLNGFYVFPTICFRKFILHTKQQPEPSLGQAVSGGFGLA